MRSKYPQLDLAASIRYLDKNSTSVAQKNGAHKRDDLLPLLSFTRKSGAGQNAITSLMHYGFIEKKNSTNYNFSKEAKELVETSTTSARRKEIIQEALYRPPLFREIAANAKDDQFPKDIFSKHGIADDKIGQVMSIYQKSKSYAEDGALDNEQTVTTKTPVAPLPHVSEKIEVDFGNGMIVSVPKKIVLDAYLAELQKISQSL